jgi:hypothetical protein
MMGREQMLLMDDGTFFSLKPAKISHRKSPTDFRMFGGESPSTCHPSRGTYAKGLCRSCYEKQLKEKNPEYAERQRINCRTWCDQYKDKKKNSNKNYKHKLSPEYARIRGLQRYGLTPDDYARMLQQQGDVCAICKKVPAKGRRLNVDHDHVTGQVRGLLCFRCNVGLSWFNETLDTMRDAYMYLQRSSLDI